jgi:TPR repeat protein
MKALKQFYFSSIALACTLGLTACAAQPDWYAIGKTNFTRHAYQQALPQLLWSAEMGNHEAQYAVGYMYYNGLGTPADDVLAYHWLQKAAKAGNPRARAALDRISDAARVDKPNIPGHHKHHHKHHGKHKHHKAQKKAKPLHAKDLKAIKHLPKLPQPIQTQPKP